MIFKPKRLLTRLFGNEARVTNRSLRLVNFLLAGLYAVQGAAILLFGMPYHRPLNVFFLTTDSLQTTLTHQPMAALAVRQLLSVNIAWLVAAWLLVMAALHLAFATICRTNFEADVRRGVNLWRWIAFSASWALILISLGLLVGMSDVGSLLLVAALAAFMGLCGYGMETHTIPQTKRKQSVQWPYGWVAMKAGLVPWLIIVLYVAAAHIFGSGRVLPIYIYPLMVTALVFFAAVGVNRYLMRSKRAAWRDSAYGELWYMVLGLLITTAVAWQIFAAVLRP